MFALSGYVGATLRSLDVVLLLMFVAFLCRCIHLTLAPLFFAFGLASVCWLVFSRVSVPTFSKVQLTCIRSNTRTPAQPMTL